MPMKGFFRPPLAFSIVVLMLTPIFVLLGVWQLHRADEKRDLQARYDRYARAEPLSMSRQPESVEALRFHRVRAHGTY